MTSVVLANVDYQRHTSTEGNELQEGLRHAGWILSGKGYDGLQNVGAIIDRYRPDRIFVQDVRDWLPQCNIAFRKDVGFDNVGLIGRSGIPAFTVIKDAWGWPAEQAGLAESIKARAIVAYYRLDMVRRVAKFSGADIPWIGPYALRRIHHSVDADAVRSLRINSVARRQAVVSGFLQPCYPIRRMAFEHAPELGLDVIRHPGYGNHGADTPNYLRQIAGYKVHLATASQWGCAFRKIIESVACGVTPITNLPASDVLPEIDDALVRIPDDIHTGDLRSIIAAAADAWNLDERMHYSEKALAYYDWRASGERLSSILEAA